MIRKILPLSITLVLLYVIHVLTFRYGSGYPLVPAFVAVIITYFFSGVLIGSATAFVLSLYAITFSPDFFSASIVVVSFGVALVPLFLYEISIREIETADKILSTMQQIHAISLSLMVNWGDWSDEEKFDFAEKVHTQLADILTISRGWRLLAKERNIEMVLQAAIKQKKKKKLK